jgi:LPPG:FO 2-phospho-L-lactate transferase
VSGEIVCLSGGVGGAKLALGLYRVLPPGGLVLGLNTGDDFTHLGLEVWPDFDTALYTLSGLGDRERGWGRADETWSFMDAVRGWGGEDWFNLGDRDLATHVLRTQALRAGQRPAEVADRLARAAGLTARLTPVSDDPVRTVIDTADGALAFQDYFVRHRAQPTIVGVRYEGAETAGLASVLDGYLSRPDIAGVVIAPSNPLLSIGPMLAIEPLRRALKACTAPVVAVTPIVGGAAIKGPTAQNLSDLSMEVSPVAVAGLYSDLIDGFVLDAKDRGQEPAIRDLGLDCRVAQTVMTTDTEKCELAREVIDFLAQLRTRSGLRHGRV